MNHIFILTQKGCNTVLENTVLQPLRDSLSYKKSLILSRLPRLRNLVSALTFDLADTFTSNIEVLTHFF